MEFNIRKFLKDLAGSASTLPDARAQVKAQIEKYEGMKLVLGNATQNPEFTENLLVAMDEYLQDLQFIFRKLHHPHLALIKLSEKEDAQINASVLEILKMLNKQDKTKDPA